jgi:hypothetical protein
MYSYIAPEERVRVPSAPRDPNPEGRGRRFWIKRRDLLRSGDPWSEKLVDALGRVAVPPRNDPAYTFLR